ncbi:MAG: 50S ribosomal protein L23 [Patescibacteria group bacterium]|nr:50S ribosomal protein L23 [Patescibacteria group bacterium]MCL5224298.1 50S ribosomal protein L23 [Patescibacteria group bacterium]
MLQNKTNVIIKPWIAEKATNLSKFRQYVFLVRKEANSKQIKEELKNIYNVHAIKINILNRASSKSEKKAVVTVKEGEKIEILPQ